MKTANPKGAAMGTSHASHGGSWEHDVELIVASFRNFEVPDLRYGYLGFRVVCNGRKG